MTATVAPPTSASSTRLGMASQFALLAGPLLSMLDSSVVNVATADIARDTGHPVGDVQWVASSYLLALGVGLCLTPFFVRRFGTLRPYRIALVLFTLASAGCAVAPDLWTLVGARLAQGLVAAPLVPLAMGMMLGNAEEKRELPVAAGFVLFAAPALGPTVGGLLISTSGWPMIFWLNVPIGFAALAATRRLPAELETPSQPAGFDLAGLAILAPALCAILWGAHQGPSAGWSEPSTVAWLGGGVLGLVAYVRYANRRRNALIDLGPLSDRQTLLAIGLASVSTVVSFAAVFITPIYAQQVQGHGPAAVGLALLPAGVLTGLGTMLGEKMLQTTSLRTTVVVGFAALTVSTAPLAWFAATTPLWVLALVLTGRAVAIGLVTTPLLVAITARVRPGQAADLNTSFNIAMRVTASIGIALLGSVFANQAQAGLPVAGLHQTAWVMTTLAAGSFLAAWRLAIAERKDASR